MTVRRSSRRARTPRLAGLAALTAISLAGCGSDLHPGTAAVVNGTTISQDSVDDLVSAACDYSQVLRELSGGLDPTLALGSLRTSLTEALITFQLSDEAADELGLTVSNAMVTKVASGNDMPSELDDHTAEVIGDFFRDAARSNLQQGVIGAHEQDDSVTTADKVTQADVTAGATYLRKFAKKQDITVDPRYGTWDGSTLKTASGSLSDPVSDSAKQATVAPAEGENPAAGLPASQVCG